MRVAVDDILILDAGEIVETKLDDISVNHLLIGLAHLVDLILH